VTGAAAAEIATVASRVARPIAGYLEAGETKPARDLLAVFAAFPYIICADVLNPDGTAAASWPAIGCARINRAGDDISLALPGSAGNAGELVVRYDADRVLEDLRRESAILAALAVIGGLAILLPALITFLWIINRPLARLLGAIEAFQLRDVAERVDYQSNDEIGQVISSYNAMLDLEVQRVAEIRDAHQAVVDSVTYASRIQRGLLPTPERLREVFADAAVLWEPRDVVGGDIYWLAASGNRPTAAVIDCTGHGVPGALLSMLAISTLERITSEAEDLPPGEILHRLNKLMRRLLNQDVPGAASNDGLDATICQVDARARTVTVAGARLSLLVATGKEVTRIRGDKVSIGYPSSPDGHCFAETTLPLDSATRLFLVSDGLIDQPGGPKRLAFGYRRLTRSLAAGADDALRAVVDSLRIELDSHALLQPRRDDVTILALSPRLG
jgi:serine phosphatase RsbU (regulator of sigma subunit)